LAGIHQEDNYLCDSGTIFVEAHFMKTFLFSLAFLLALSSFAQKDIEVVQLSGIVVTGDSLSPVPFAGVFTSSRPYQGVATDYFGFFSVVAEAGDTVNFSSVGYVDSKYVIPENPESDRLSVVQLLRRDTIDLPTTFIYPWPTPERFKEEFLALDLPDTDRERAEKNLESRELYERMQEMGMTSRESFRYATQRQHEQLLYANQAPPISVLNPIAWAKFIQSWKDGDFKRKDKYDYED
jgi:hypothetical protein